MYVFYYLIIKSVFLRFTNLDIFPYKLPGEWINVMLLIHNPEYWVKECLSNLFLPLHYLHFYILLHTPISNIFLSGKSQVESWGKRTYFYITPPLSMESSQNLGSVVENYHSEICTPSLFFKDLCFCPTGKVIKSLKFNVWVKKSFRNTDFLKSNIVGSQSLRQKLFS